MTKKSEKKRLGFKVRINGTSENPWHRLGLKQNPFPQLARMEWDRGMRAIQSLDGEPVKSTQDIIDRLKGRVSDELIDLCVSQFIPGERVEFEVFWEEDE